MATVVDTTKVTERRQVHFDSLDDILADVERLAKSPNIKALGNWSPGQVLSHLAIALNKSIDGYENRPPALVRVVARSLFKRRFLTKTMSAGFKLPAKAMDELTTPPVPFEEGLQSFRQAIRRLKTETKRAPNPVLGELTPAEWIQFHCRHAELHLSFLVPA
ncbi:MAG: DUF1569 domain-containing protein [Isosphaerales bacterium]